MDLKKGDWILPFGDKGLEDKLIKGLQFGKVVHAAMVYDKDTVFETDGAWLKAKFALSSKYATVPYVHVRPLFYAPDSPVQALCKRYEGSPYAYWHIATDSLFSWLHPTLRRGLVSLLAWSKFMVCSELVARITFEATGYHDLRKFLGWEPEDLRQLALANPADFQVTVVNL